MVETQLCKLRGTFYRKLKNVSCEYDLLNGRHLTLQAACVGQFFLYLVLSSPRIRTIIIVRTYVRVLFVLFYVVSGIRYFEVPGTYVRVRFFFFFTVLYVRTACIPGMYSIRYTLYLCIDITYFFPWYSIRRTRALRVVYVCTWYTNMCGLYMYI